MTASQKEAAKAAATPVVAVWFHAAGDDTEVRDLTAQSRAHALSLTQALSTQTSHRAHTNCFAPTRHTPPHPRLRRGRRAGWAACRSCQSTLNTLRPRPRTPQHPLPAPVRHLCFRRTRTRKTYARTSAHAHEGNTLTRLWCRYKGRDDADDLEGSNHTPAAVATFIMQHLPQIVSVFQPSELPILHRSTPLHNAPQPNRKPLPPSLPLPLTPPPPADLP